MPSSDVSWRSIPPRNCFSRTETLVLMPGGSGRAFLLFGSTIPTLIPTRIANDLTTPSLAATMLFAPTGRVLAVRFRGRPVEIWNYQIGRKIQELPLSTIGGEVIDFRNDGRRIIVAMKDDRPMQIFDVETAEFVAELKNGERNNWSRLQPRWENCRDRRGPLGCGNLRCE